jgi:hypothetical protein
MECAPRPWHTLNPEHPPVAGYNGFAKCQAQAQPVHFACETCIDPVETLEDTSQMLRRDAHPMIADLHLDQRFASRK